MVKRERLGRVGTTDVIFWRSPARPPALDGLVVPEDTYLLLHAATDALDPDASPLDLWAALERAARAEKQPLGSVIIEDGARRGVTYIARVVVYDFDGEPICHPETVRAGLADALNELVRRGCDTLGVSLHGPMRGGLSREALNEVVVRLDVASPRTLHLLEQEEGASEPGPGA